MPLHGVYPALVVQRGVYAASGVRVDDRGLHVVVDMIVGYGATEYLIGFFCEHDVGFLLFLYLQRY